MKPLKLLQEHFYRLLTGYSLTEIRTLVLENETLAKALKYLSYRGGKPLSTTQITGTASDLEEKFFAAKGKSHRREDYAEERAKLTEIVFQLSSPLIPAAKIRRSAGLSGSGTWTLLNSSIRRKDGFDGFVEASLEECITKLVGEQFPERTQFGLAVGNDSVGIYLSESYDGYPMFFAPSDIIRHNLEETVRLATMKPPENIEYHPENYTRKLHYEAASYFEGTYDIPTDLCDQLHSVGFELFTIAKKNGVPFWDGHCLSGNVKTDGSTVKWFDFNQVRTLVIPVHEGVQIVYTSSKSKEEAEEYAGLVKEWYGKYGDMQTTDISTSWDLASFYFLVRQVYKGVEQKDEDYKRMFEYFLYHASFERELFRDFQSHYREAVDRRGGLKSFVIRSSRNAEHPQEIKFNIYKNEIKEDEQVYITPLAEYAE